MSANSQPAPVLRRPERRGLSAKHREWIAGYLFVLPDAIGLFIFLGLPTILSLVLGLYKVDGFGSFQFIGLANYKRMMIDPIFWSSVWVTAKYVVVLVPALYISGLALALLVQKQSKVNTVLRSMFFAPQMVSLVVVALIWQFLVVDKLGLLSRLAAMLGFGTISLLGDPTFALYTVIGVCVWFLMGFYMLIFLGGLQDIPKEYYEAARIDGAGAISSFWYITLPLLRPTSFFIVLVSLVAAVAGAQAFDVIFVMTKGGPANATSVLVLYIYQQAFGFGAFGYAAAMSSILVAALMVITLVFFLATRGGRFNYA